MQLRSTYVATVFFLAISFLTKGQDTTATFNGTPANTVTRDSSRPEKADTLPWDERIAGNIVLALKKDKERNPSKAVLWSAIIPGGGQVYNKQYYKVPLVYGAVGAMIYFIDFNRDNLDLYETAYENRLKGEPTPQFPASIPDVALLNRRDQYRKQLELSYIGAGFVYLLNIADAFVSAHLSSFDISDDLGIDIGPVSGSYGLGFGIKFRVK